MNYNIWAVAVPTYPILMLNNFTFVFESWCIFITKLHTGLDLEKKILKLPEIFRISSPCRAGKAGWVNQTASWAAQQVAGQSMQPLFTATLIFSNMHLTQASVAGGTKLSHLCFHGPPCNERDDQMWKWPFRHCHSGDAPRQLVSRCSVAHSFKNHMYELILITVYTVSEFETMLVFTSYSTESDSFSNFYSLTLFFSNPKFVF